MTRDEAVERFRTLDAPRQVSVLAWYGHLVTVHARETYVPGTDAVADPRRLREANELLHRVLAHIGHIADNRRERYPDDVLVTIFWGDYPLMARASRLAFEEALDRHDTSGEQRVPR